MNTLRQQIEELRKQNKLPYVLIPFGQSGVALMVPNIPLVGDTLALCYNAGDTTMIDYVQLDEEPEDGWYETTQDPIQLMLVGETLH